MGPAEELAAIRELLGNLPERLAAVLAATQGGLGVPPPRDTSGRFMALGQREGGDRSSRQLDATERLAGAAGQFFPALGKIGQTIHNVRSLIAAWKQFKTAFGPEGQPTADSAPPFEPPEFPKPPLDAAPDRGGVPPPESPSGQPQWNAPLGPPPVGSPAAFPQPSQPTPLPLAEDAATSPVMGPEMPNAPPEVPSPLAIEPPQERRPYRVAESDRPTKPMFPRGNIPIPQFPENHPLVTFEQDDFQPALDRDDTEPPMPEMPAASSDMPSPTIEEQEAEGFPTFPEVEQPAPREEGWDPFGEQNDLPSPQASVEGNMADVVEQLGAMVAALQKLASNPTAPDEEKLSEGKGVAERVIKMVEGATGGKDTGDANVDKYFSQSLGTVTKILGEMAEALI